MTPEYLNELADLADPDQLWRINPLDINELPEEKKRQRDTGIALRRHAARIGQLIDLLGTGKSLVLTPLSKGSSAVMTIDAPKEHKKLLDQRARNAL